MEYKYREYPKQDEDPLFLKYKDFTAKTALELPKRKHVGSELGMVLEQIYQHCWHLHGLDKQLYVCIAEEQVKDRPQDYVNYNDLLNRTVNDFTQVNNFRFKPETINGLVERGFHFHAHPFPSSKHIKECGPYLCQKCGELRQTYLKKICWQIDICPHIDTEKRNIGKVYKTVCVCESSIPFQIKPVVQESPPIEMCSVM